MKIITNIKKELEKHSKYININGLSITILRLIKHEYQTNIDRVIKMYLVYKDLLAHYKPMAIILPGMNYLYNVIIQIANYEKKETSYHPVGYILSADKDKEDKELQSRNKVIKERIDRLRSQSLTRVVKKI